MSERSEAPLRHLPRLAVQALFLALYHFLLGGEPFLYPLMPLLALLAWGIASIPPVRRLRLFPALFAGAVFPWLVRPVAGALLVLVSRVTGTDGFALIAWESAFFLYVLPFTLILLSNLVVDRYPATAVWGISAGGLLLLVLARFRHRFDEVLAPQEYFVRSVLLALVLIVLQLVLFLLFHARSRPGRKKGRGDVLLPLLLFLPLLILLLSLASSGSLSAGGGLMQSGLFRFDFSDYLKLESRISMSDDLVLLLRKEGPSERIYLRRFILSGYSPKKGFYRDDRKDPESRQTKVPRRPVVLPVPEQGISLREPVKQDLYLITLPADTLLGMNRPEKIIPYVGWPDSSFKGVYTVHSQVSQAAIYDLVFSDTGEMSGSDRTFFTDYGNNEAIRELAEEVAGGVENHYSRTAAIETWLKENYYYSLKPGTSPDGNQLEYFLFDSRKGYCSYFAFAMTLMCRSLDIPARVVVGFYVNPESGVMNFYPVQANQAHAWVEVWFDDYGWIEFDPTSETMAPGETFEFGNPSPDTFIPLIEEILNNQDLLTEMDGPDDTKNGNLFWNRYLAPLFRSSLRFGFLIPALWLLLLILSRYRYRLFAGPSESERYRARYSERLDRLIRAGLPRKRKETLLAYAVRLERFYRIGLTPATALYLKAVFSPVFGPADLAAGSTALAEADKGWRRLPFGRRLLAFLYPVPRFRRLP